MSYRVVFKGRTPPAYVAVFILLAINFCAGFVLSDWGWVLAPDALHPYGIRFRGGHWRYYPPRVGWYVDHWIGLHFALLAVAGFILWWYRDQLKKLEPLPPASGPVRTWEWAWLVTVIPVAFSGVGGFVISIFAREAGWETVVVTVLVFLAMTLATVFLAARPLAPRSPPPLEWPMLLGLAAAMTIAALVLGAWFFDRLG